MENIEEQVKIFIEQIKKDLERGVKINLADKMEELMLKDYPEENKKAYFAAKSVFVEFNKKMQELFPNKMIAEVIKNTKETGQDRLLTSRQEIIKKYIVLAIERQLLIIKVLSKILKKEVILSKIVPDYDKYTLANFYRTLCEITTRLFADSSFLILDDLIEINKNKIISQDNEENKEKLSELQKKLKNLDTYSFGLDDLRYVLGSFEKQYQKIGLITIMDSYLEFKEGEGFSLRNEVAHDKKYFSEWDNNRLIESITRVNLLNMSFIVVFYINYLADLAKNVDFNLVNKLFFN